MIQCGNDDLMTDERTVSYLDAALVLKTASRIDENVFAQHDVFPAIGVKRRKKPERGRHFSARQAGKQLDDFFCRVVSAVEFGGDFLASSA